MNELFQINTIKLNLIAKTKNECIDELIDLLYKDGVLNNISLYKKMIMQRENESSTGIGFGIAIPHAKSSAVNSSRVAIGITKKGIDFNSPDKTLAFLIFMIAVPEGADNEHIRLLQLLSRKLIDPVFRSNLINAKSVEEISVYLENIKL